MKFVIASVVSCVVLFLSKLALDGKLANKIGLFRAKNSEEQYVSKHISVLWQWLISAVVMIAVFFAMVEMQNKVTNVLGVTKMTVAMICMVGAACFDFREHRIPNIFPAVLALSALILLTVGWVSNQPDAVAYITSSAFAAISCVIFLLLAAALTKQGIGAGDIKLIGALALMTGVHAIIGTLFFGVVSCSIVTIVTLVLKKKNMSSTVPFGPFLLLGYIATLFFVYF